MISIILSAALAGSAPGSAPEQDQWLACARSVAEDQLEQGIPDTWPKVDSLPNQEPSVTSVLSSIPDEQAYDPVHRTLHGYGGATSSISKASVASETFMFSTGPFLWQAGAPRLHAMRPNNSFKPKPLRGSA